MSSDLRRNSRLSASDVQRIYLKHGTNITLEEAKQILEFVARLATMAIDQALRKKQERPPLPPTMEDSKSQDESIY